MSYYIQPCVNNSEAEYVVLSSGLGGHASFWKPQIEFLSQYFHVFSYDQEGCHADSSLLADHYSFKDLGQQIFEIIRRENIERFHFIGHAIGSFIGAELAVLCQNEYKAATTSNKMLSLTCINAWDQLDPHTAKCFDTRIHLLKYVGVEAYVRAQALFLYPSAWISAHHQKIKQAENMQLQDFPPKQNVLARIQAAQQFKVDEQHRQALENVSLHFIANTDDFLVPVQKSKDLMQSLQHGTLNIIHSGAHASTLTETDSVNTVLLDFYQTEQFLS